MEVPDYDPGKEDEIDEEEFKNRILFLDWLNEGSCFCVYTAFNKEMTQLVNYKASTTCFIESIKIKDLK